MSKTKISYSYLIGDLLHFGHLQLLKKAKERCDLHICGVISDKAASEWQSPLICNYIERSNVIKQIKYVDKIMKQDSLDPSKNLKKIIKEYPNALIYFFPMYQKWNFLPGTKIINDIQGKIIKPGFYSKLSRDNISKAFKKLPKPNVTNRILRNKANYNHSFDINTSKAETLKNLSNQLKKSYIEKLFIFTIEEWNKSKDRIINKSQEIFGNKKIVVRSSSLSEDTINASGAGMYHSELNVDNDNKSALKKAINKVKQSYSKGKRQLLDQIIIQEQSNDVLISGVCLTRNLKNNAPYYVINFDDKSTYTDTVTSGQVGDKIEIIRNIDLKKIPAKWKNLVISIKEIEDLLPNLALDIEFAINKNKEIIIFQVRPLATSSKYPEYNDFKIYEEHKKIQEAYKKKLNNNEVIFSDMGFWNPAELIGDRPTPLGESLFNEILMNRVWNTSLKSLGYSKIDGCLSTRIGNKPYINLKKSFETLLPKTINTHLKNKLINYYYKKLKKYPEYHDKLEFEIILSSLNFKTDEEMYELLKNGFTNKEVTHIKKSLHALTKRIFDNYKKIYSVDTKAINDLINLYTYKKTTKDNWKKNLVEIIKYIDNIKSNGTPQFCRAARMTFIAKDFIKSFVDQNPKYRETSTELLSRIKTISSDLQNDLSLIQNSKSRNRFFRKYGHLRPDTYNINNKRYDQMNNLLSKNIQRNTNGKKKTIGLDFKNEINISLKRLKLNHDYSSFMDFVDSSIKNRERYKFEYTKVLSGIIEMIADIGLILGIEREDLSYIDYQTLKMIAYSSNIDMESSREICLSLITARKIRHEILNQISLPSLLFNIKDLSLITNHTIVPNFITDKMVECQIINIKNQEAKNIANKIVIIDNADPGYDWVFSHKIRGLVTMYGGLASHMAIRCAEFNIPAAIGCGALIYNVINSSEKILLDCKNKKIKKII